MAVNPYYDGIEPVLAATERALGDRYAIDTPLDVRADAVLFRARELATGREVVLEVSDPRRGAIAIERIARETAIAARLDHPNIIPILDAGAGEDVAYRASPLLALGTVEEALEDGNPIPLREVVLALHGVAAALDHAHARGVVHGALTPSRLALADDGRCFIDGFAIDRGHGAGARLAPSAVGSPAYMSPEQRRDVVLDGASDQYALGIIAYEMLTGQRRAVVDGGSGVVELHAIEIPPNRPLHPELPLEVNAALRRAIAREPSFRFETVGDFVDALARAEEALDRRDRRPASAIDWRALAGALAVTVLIIVFGALALGIVPEALPDRLVDGWQRVRGFTGARVRAVSVPIPSVTVAGPSELHVPSGPSSAGGTSARPAPVISRVVPPAPTIRVGAVAARGASGGEVASPVVPPSGPTARIVPVPRTVAGAGAPPASVAPAHRAGVGHLAVSVDSGAAFVVIDGVVRAPAPLVTAITAGRHRVAVRGARFAYTPEEVVVSTVAGDTARVLFTARRQPRPPEP